MDVASAILVLQLQVEDNEEILAISNRQEDFHAALTLHLFDLRERLQVLQDHSMAFRPLGAVGQETLDGIFGPYHAPSTSQEPLEPKLSASSSLKDDERAANRPADHEPEPHLDESTRTTSQEAGQVADLGPQLQVHESIDSPISASSSALHHSKRKAEELAGQEELNDPKQRKLSEDAHRNDSLEVEVLSYDMIATEANPDLVTSGDVLVNVESGLQQDASPETFHDTVVASVISEGPARCPCVACLTIFAEDSLIQCPCDHKYCAQCLTEHFRAGLQGIAFPPSCCYEEIPFTLAQPHLSIKLQANYAKKKRVIDNPGTIYCALLSCQALIAPENISNGRATCVCMTITCVVCKFTAHDDACPEDTERAALLQLAVTQGLRACYRCGELYERDFGCNHMTYMSRNLDTLISIC